MKKLLGLLVLLLFPFIVLAAFKGNLKIAVTEVWNAWYEVYWDD